MCVGKAVCFALSSRQYILSASENIHVILLWLCKSDFSKAPLI